MNKKINKIIASILIIAFLAMQCSSVFAYTKDETVYSKTNNNGERYQTIVSAHLKNTNSENELVDSSILDNIKNTNGNETFTKEGEKIVWNSNGEDIYYQGDTDKELPIDMKITYKLDGKDINGSELIGKKGKVEIDLNFINKEEHTININGTDTKLYTPFVVISALILENDNVKNMEISNGKIIDNGKNSLVTGICMPGMQESLGLTKDDIEIPSDIKISFETENFELGSIMTYITPDIIENTDLDKINKLDELFNQMNELKDSSEKLVDGTTTLNEGISALNSSVSDLKNGTSTLSEGTSKAYNGAEQIANNMKKITSGTDSLVSGQEEVATGLNQIKEELPTDKEIQTKQSNLNTLNNTNLKTIESLQTANSQIDAQINSINSQLTDLNNQIAELEKLIEATGDENLKNTLKAMKSTKVALAAMESSLEQQKNANSQLVVLLKTNNQALNESSEELESTKVLKNGMDKLYKATKELENGAKTLQKGSKELYQGTSTLSSSMKELNNGAKTLNKGTSLLKGGTDELQKGSKELKSGMIQFDEQGIKKLYNAVNGDLRDLKTRVQKLQDLTNEYVSFSGNSENKDDVVKFILITDELKKNDNEVITSNNTNIQNQTTNKNEKNTEGE